MEDKYKYNNKNATDIEIGKKTLRIFSPISRSSVNHLILDHCRKLFKLEQVKPYIALMPDFHPGSGNIIGSVVPAEGIILIDEVGGDIGCGMLYCNLGIPSRMKDAKLNNLFSRLKEVIPVGKMINPGAVAETLSYDIFEREFKAGINSNTLRNSLKVQMGTLGSGNHFLELQSDVEGNLAVMIHSGSRSLGLKVRDYYSQFCIDQDNNLPLYLESESQKGQDYLHDMELCLEYSRMNRYEMLKRTLKVVSDVLHVDLPAELTEDQYVDTNHNFCRIENHFGMELFVHRKGAISARKGEYGIVPGSMGTTSYLVQGRGLAFSFDSCSHGAGRKFSRGDAFKKISDMDFQKSMKGIVADVRSSHKDEAPMAYKNIKDVMKYQKDSVKIINTLNPLLVLKG